MSEWINAKNRLPAVLSRVLVYDPDEGYCTIAEGYKNGWALEDFSMGGFEKITHWMPLPKPPEGD